MERIAIRSLEARDHGLLVSATLGNLNWCGERFTREDITDSPEFFATPGCIQHVGISGWWQSVVLL